MQIIKVNLKIFFQIALFVSALALLFSCDRKSCKDVVCTGYNQTCYDGECSCVNGYEGTNCDIETYQKYIGSYNVGQTCESSLGGNSASPWTSSYISTGGRIDIIRIGNFAGMGPEIEAYINGTYDLIIPEQNQGAIEVSAGEGEYNQYNHSIQLRYVYRLNNNSYSCTANLFPR